MQANMKVLIELIAESASVWAFDEEGRMVKRVCVDPMILSCGCCVSETLANHLSRNHSSTFRCPECNADDVYGIKIQQQLANISNYLLDDNVVSTLSRSTSRKPSEVKKNQSLLTAFQEAFSEAQRSKTQNYYESPIYLANGEEVIDKINKESSNNSLDSASPPLRRVAHTSSSSSSLPFNPVGSSFVRNNSFSSNLTKMLSRSPNFNMQTENSSFHNNVNNNNNDNNINNNNINDVKNDVTSNITNKNESVNLELLLAKNFPFYRRLHTHHLQPSFFLKTRTFICTAMSPSIEFLVLLSEKKWQVYTTDAFHPEKPPVPYCEGRSDGSYGKTQLTSIKKQEIVRMSNFGDPNNQAMKKEDLNDSINGSLALLDSWEHLSCKLTNNLLIIGGTRGFLRIIALKGPNPGRILYTYQAKFPIRCFDISPNEKFIAIGVTGRDKYTQVEQAVIVILKLEFGPSGDLLIFSYPFTLPYRDPLTLLKFSPDSNLLSVATALESRFMTISIRDPTCPSLLMKSQRRLDTTLDAEGITDLSYFSDQRLMTLTSVSHTSSPIILDTNIPSVVVPDGIARPKLILKVDEVGSLIHSCAPSPRGDAVAYLGRNGTVYVMSFSSARLEDHSSRDSRRTVDVASVARGTRRRDAAYMQWDKEGYRLWMLDRIGCLTIIDWVSGTVDDLKVSRCKIVS